MSDILQGSVVPRMRRCGRIFTDIVTTNCFLISTINEFFNFYSKKLLAHKNCAILAHPVYFYVFVVQLQETQDPKVCKCPQQAGAGNAGHQESLSLPVEMLHALQEEAVLMLVGLV